jgi:hypothetical protein
MYVHIVQLGRENTQEKRNYKALHLKKKTAKKEAINI